MAAVEGMGTSVEPHRHAASHRVRQHALCLLTHRYGTFEHGKPAGTIKPGLCYNVTDYARTARPGSAMSTSSAGGAGGGGAQYTLEPITWEARPYLLDRRTGAVYADSGAADAYPELVGRWQDGRLVLRSRNVVVDLFAGLDRYLRENKVGCGVTHA